MRTEEDWIKEKINAYDKSKEDTLIEMLEETTDVIKQFVTNPKSKATKVLLENCLKCNKIFLNKINH